MFKLGQEVVITGKFVKVAVNPVEVAQSIEQIKETGALSFSRKYDIEKFGAPKWGIVVGVRSIVSGRMHRMESSFGEQVYTTQTKRQQAYVVACNMRGLYYVPTNMIEDAEVYDFAEEFEREETLG